MAFHVLMCRQETAHLLTLSTWHCRICCWAPCCGAVLLPPGCRRPRCAKLLLLLRWDRQTDRLTEGRTLYRCLDAAPHTMRAISITGLSQQAQLRRFGPGYSHGIGPKGGSLEESLWLEWFVKRAFNPRVAMLVRALAMALCLSVCVCLSKVGVLSKGVNGLSRFLHVGFFRPVLHCFKEILVSTK